MHGFMNAKSSMLQGHCPACQCFLYPHIPAADGTRSGGLAYADCGAGERTDLFPVLLAQGVDFRSQRRERGEREPVVFFTPYLLKTASTCSGDTDIPRVARRAAIR